MKEHVSLLRLDNQGAVLFIYSDKLKIYVIYHDEEADKLYKFVCDKHLIVETVHEIDTPAQFFDFTSIHWHKPTLTANGDFVYSGVAHIGDNAYTFKINDVDKMLIGPKSTQNQFSLLPMESLKNISVEHYIQKSNKLYATGLSLDTNEQVFLIVDIAQDKILRLYTLMSGFGEIVVRTINIDVVESKIYIGGVVFNSEADTVRPYFESFLIPEA